MYMYLIFPYFRSKMRGAGLSDAENVAVEVGG
jgi:hypothetical protein